ncbi:hypothetical protein KM043_015326 [Ampulex compressa]|nr:hypothetical protein KM043_015326 [Ampulex compressa]
MRRNSKHSLAAHCDSACGRSGPQSGSISEKVPHRWRYTHGNGEQRERGGQLDIQSGFNAHRPPTSPAPAPPGTTRWSPRPPADDALLRIVLPPPAPTVLATVPPFFRRRTSAGAAGRGCFLARRKEDSLRTVRVRRDVVLPMDPPNGYAGFSPRLGSRGIGSRRLGTTGRVYMALCLWRLDYDVRGFNYFALASVRCRLGSSWILRCAVDRRRSFLKAGSRWSRIDQLLILDGRSQSNSSLSTKSVAFERSDLVVSTERSRFTSIPAGRTAHFHAKNSLLKNGIPGPRRCGIVADNDAYGNGISAARNPIGRPSNKVASHGR